VPRIPDAFSQTHYSDCLCRILHLNMAMESIYLSDWFQSHGVIVIVLLFLLQPTDVSFLHSLTQWQKTTWFSTQIMWKLILITCYCKLIIVFFTTGYPHQLRHFLSLLYFQFHPTLFPQLSNEDYLPFFQWTLRFSAQPTQPTRLLIAAKNFFHLLLIPAFASTLHLFQIVFVRFLLNTHM
jgi:hypothetical protein